MPRIYHPVLDRTVTVPESTARVLARSGWVDADDVEPDDEPSSDTVSEDSDN